VTPGPTPGPTPGTTTGTTAGLTPVPAPNFAHLRQMSDGHGTFEHARFSEPRPEHGYCTDDMARVLVVATREDSGAGEMDDLSLLSLGFLSSASGASGGCRNRMNRHGAWEDLAACEDAWGRRVWALGFTAAHGRRDAIRRAAAGQLEQTVVCRSIWPRAMAYAALGAAELLSVQPDHAEGRALLEDAVDALDGLGRQALGQQARWAWPESRLAYANAVVPEALIAAGVALQRAPLLRRGLGLLSWLLDHETLDGHLSVTPVGGAAPDDRPPAFDQQPIEVAALADACARAATVDDAPQWAAGVRSAAAWFLGDNDAGVVMWDPRTGGGFDGLRSDGVNRNQGTESTLALLSTLQQARQQARQTASLRS
jgi:hypothetical protein